MTRIDSGAFTTALAKLNLSQREAVDTIEGPVMVIAGPGTGKTQILTLRIANILRLTDTKPEQILALTFTDSGVRAMRTRLSSFIGADAYHVPIHTFHSFAGELIRRYPDSYKYIVGGRPATDIEKISIIEELLEDVVIRRLRPHGDHGYYVKPILDAIGTLKKENITPTDFSSYISKQEQELNNIEKIHEKGAHKGKVRGEYLEAEKFLEKNKELLYIYQRYIAILRDRKLFDFEDMILDTIDALENNQEMLFDVQEQYQYILADEHQDVNQSQNRLIELISSYHEQPNVFVVGDEKQAIYRFQGASLDNFLYFGDSYKEAKIISLTSNYRSDQKILDIAHDCIATEDPRLKDLRVPLIAEQKFDVTLSQQSFSHAGIEDAWVVDEIKKHHKQGVVWGEMAIIVRTNREVERFANLLRKADVPVAPSADGDILQHPITNSVLNLLKSVTNPTDESALAELLHAPYLGIKSTDLVTLLAARSYNNRLIDLLSSADKLSEIGIQDVSVFLKIQSLFDQAHALELTQNPAQVTEYVLRESGFIEFVLAEDAFESVRVVRRLYDEIERMFTCGEAKDLKSVLERFSLSEKYNLSLSAPFIQTSTNAVGVMTAHKAKGLEFEVVMIPHLTDNVWGATKRASLFKLPLVKHNTDTDPKILIEDDERRLFYVGITRAKRVLQCSYSSMNAEGRELSPSRFLVALDTDKIVSEAVDHYEESFQPLNDIKSVPAQTLNADFLRTTLLRRGWSATAFNNYCKSPWEYVYKNALRIPMIKTPELQFGSFVHAVLEKIARYIVEKGKAPSESEINDWLAVVFGGALSVQEFTRQHERAFEALAAYLPLLEQSMGVVVKTEYSIKATLKTGIDDFPEVLLTGNFDRLDFDEEGRVVRVLDYKTGKAKTRGEIEGTTKTSNGSYKRQLVFYALLLSLHPDERFHCKTGVLSFVEPDQKGLIHEETFTITDEEIEALRLQILAATKSVVSGECLQVECDIEQCDYCHLVDLLK